ncbi:hypothetical protein [Coleofasciculus sp. E1-EBD-02]|uniref:hypothetical protein n=1 Tax=Coleofasciculus sp. E1-EBD-02 TaxID=3068481 RepID=UPI0033039993
MAIWIVTIGSSDVQLDSDKISKEKGRGKNQYSNKKWTDWYEDNILSECHDIKFELKQTYNYVNQLYRIEPRVLGTVYQYHSPQIQEQIFSYLTFPLLDTFVERLKAETDQLDQIIVLLTDQSQIFSDNYTQRKITCPYWQDTHKLQPILARYFQAADKFPNTPCEWINLAPKSNDPGLDDWDYVLTLVREKLGSLQLEEPENQEAESKTIYVSHQASTPAISSAVQFETLLRFGEGVKFLVCSEWDETLTQILPCSTYLRGIRQQEAKTLLERYDYSGVKAILAPYLTSDVAILLDAAILWNSAKFDQFAQTVLQYPDSQLVQKLQERTQKCNWWWTGYEAAYLGVVRLDQGNTVEAFFHSFRAVEGLIRLFADAKYKDKIQFNKYGAPYIEFSNKNRFNLFGKQLYRFLDYCCTIDSEKDKDIWRFGEVTFDKRNQYFHQLFGLSEQDVFEAWDTDNRMDWEARVLGCLNFIAEPDSPFTALDTASLISPIQDKLEKAIAQLTQTEPPQKT